MFYFHTNFEILVPAVSLLLETKHCLNFLELAVAALVTKQSMIGILFRETYRRKF